MVDSFTISHTPFEHPGMDYAFLRQEGIKLIEALASRHWTDYNTHDPGITILETLCYAITDLSYRLSFKIEDLLAYPADGAATLPLFLTAREILTVNPLTINDYRKLLIDIKGVKNAWLESIDTPQPELYYDANNAKLTFNRQELIDPVHLRGLYRVLLEPESGYPPKDLIQATKTKLNQHRNLCEDFEEIRVLDFEEITVHAELEISKEADPHILIAQIHNVLARHISPPLPLVSLQTLVSQGIPVEEVFSGPRLEHGFIDDEQLRRCERKTEFHTSDFIHLILDIPGIKTVKNITLSGSQATAQPWVLDLNPLLTPRLKSLTSTIKAGNIQFYKGQIPCELNANSIKHVSEKPLSTAPQESPSASLIFQDFPIPTGNYRELADYESVQIELPAVYGIGEIGLSASASNERKAQAKQLQAYLMVIDQLLANYFAQLDHFKELFSLEIADLKTYFNQSIQHFPGVQEILANSYELYLTQSQVKGLDLDRKNRLLEHLLAQYNETFTNHSLLYPDSRSTDTSLKCKEAFAKDYRQVSADRSQAFNYTLNPDHLQSAHNISGLKRRVTRLLGIDPAQQFLASSNEEGLYIIEHILLRPHLAKPKTDASDFISFTHTISKFEKSNIEGHVTCHSDNHGLKPGDEVKILYSTHYNGSYKVVSVNADEPITHGNTFDISHSFVEKHTNDTGQWVNKNQLSDPFSFQISVILPTWPTRFRSSSFQKLIYDICIAETPAHITLYFHWLNTERMREFETIHALWLQYLSGHVTDPTETEVSVTRLINFLKLGSTEIPALPALLGYMTISEGDNDDSMVNPFTVS